MKKWFTMAAAVGCAALSMTAFAAPNVILEGHKSTVNKQASDQDVQAALNSLQAAAAAIQQGTGGQVLNDLQSAESSLTAASPIYHGHREAAMDATERAIKIVQANKKNARQHAAEAVAKAISDAQTALQVN